MAKKIQTPKKTKVRKRISPLDEFAKCLCLSPVSEENVPDLESPFAICAATKDNFELYVSDFRLSNVFTINNVMEEETNYIGELKELLSFNSSTL